MALPDWFAAMVHVPDETPVTVLPMTVQVPTVMLEKVTGLFKAPPVAVTVPVPPTTIPGASPKTIVWFATPMLKLCVTCAAAL